MTGCSCTTARPSCSERARRDRLNARGAADAARRLDVRMVDRRAAGVRALRLRGRGRAPALGHRARRDRLLADGLVQRAGQLGGPARNRPRGDLDGDRGHELPAPHRPDRRDLAAVPGGRRRLRQAAAGARGARPRAPEPARARARVLLPVRRGRAVLELDGILPLGVLVVEHAQRRADRAARLRAVLRGGRVGVRHGRRPAPAAAGGGRHPRRGRGARRRARGGWVALAVLALAPAAFAEGDPHPDPFTLVKDGAQGAVTAQTTPDRRCPELYGGTAGLHEKDGQRALQEGLFAPLPLPRGAVRAGLPARVDLRSTTRTFNRRYAFAVQDGHVYFRPVASAAWLRLPVPSCFDGDVRGISVDDDELVAIDSVRHVFTMDGALRDTVWFNWTERWGPPFWTGGGRRLPEGDLWSWSVLSPLEDRTWTDSAGNQQPVGDAKVSHVWMVRGGGQRLVYMDPWLPADDSYEMCGPRRGRFRAIALSAAASTVFVMNQAGDMYTRLYDFDMSGADSVFLKYSYEDQRGKAGAPIQLPAVGWRRHPRIAGPIRDAISIHKTGPGSNRRVLRVAGPDGFWEKPLTGRAWTFVRTGVTLGAPVRLRRPARLAPRLDAAYATPGGEPSVTVPNFNLACSPARMEVRLAGGRRLDLTLHSVDAIRQSPRAAGLDDQPRLTQGTIEARPGIVASTDPVVHDFVARYLTGGRFTSAPIEATRGALVFKDQGWTLVRSGRTWRGPRPARG